MNRNKDKNFIEILKKMEDSSEEVIRNTASFMRNNDIPVYVMEEDIVKYEPFRLDIDENGREIILTLEQIERFAAATVCKEIFLSRSSFYMDRKFDSPQLQSTINNFGYTKERTEETSLFTMITHEANHIINREHMLGIKKPTVAQYVKFWNSLSDFEKVAFRIKDEYHAYSCAQKNIFGMHEQDIRDTVIEPFKSEVDKYFKNFVEKNCFKLDWNITNSNETSL